MAAGARRLREKRVQAAQACGFLNIGRGLAQHDVHPAWAIGDQRQHRVAVAPAPGRGRQARAPVRPSLRSAPDGRRRPPSRRSGRAAPWRGPRRRERAGRPTRDAARRAGWSATADRTDAAPSGTTKLTTPSPAASGATSGRPPPDGSRIHRRRILGTVYPWATARAAKRSQAGFTTSGRTSRGGRRRVPQQRMRVDRRTPGAGSSPARRC